MIKQMRRSAEKICWEDLLRKSAEKIDWEDLLRKSAEKIDWEDLLRKSAEKICWEDVLRKSAEKICWEDLLRRSAEKICWEDLLRRSAEKICWEDLLRKSAEKICWENLLRRSAEKICWENLLRRSAEKLCWEDLLRMVVDQDFFKISFFFLRTVGLVDQDGRPPSRHFVLVGRPKLCWNAKFALLRRNPLVTSCSSDVQNCGEMRSLHFFVATLSSLRARRTSKTEVKCESAWVLSQPSRRFVLIGRPKLWWNANFELARATLSSLRAGLMSETVVKCWFLYAAGCLGCRAWIHTFWRTPL